MGAYTSYKLCSRCDEPKHLSEFYRNTAQHDGHAGHCKACHKIAYPPNLEWYQSDKGRASQRAAAKKWGQANQDRVRAMAKLNYHLRKGTIQKLDRCTGCNSNARLDAHHENYNYALEVLWLCRECHLGLHAERRTLVARFGGEWTDREERQEEFAFSINEVPTDDMSEVEIPHARLKVKSA